MTPLSNFLENLDMDASARTIVTFMALFAITWYAWIRVKSKKGSSSLPPSPRGLPLIGNLASLDPDLHTYFAGLARTYGPILKLQLGSKLGIIVSSPDLARKVLKDHDITFANRDVPAVARIAAYGGLDIAWSPYGPEWRMLRRVCVLKSKLSIPFRSSRNGRNGPFHFKIRDKTVMFLSRFEFRSNPENPAKFRPERPGFIPGVPFRVQNQKFKTTPKEKAPLHSRLSSLCGWGGDDATKGRRFENVRNKVGLNPDYLFSDGCIFGYCLENLS